MLPVHFSPSSNRPLTTSNAVSRQFFKPPQELRSRQLQAPAHAKFQTDYPATWNHAPDERTLSAKTIQSSVRQSHRPEAELDAFMDLCKAIGDDKNALLHALNIWIRFPAHMRMKSRECIELASVRAGFPHEFKLREERTAILQNSHTFRKSLNTKRNARIHPMRLHDFCETIFFLEIIDVYGHGAYPRAIKRLFDAFKLTYSNGTSSLVHAFCG